MTHLREYLGPRRVVTVTMQTPQETLLGTPQTLPTTEPGTPQVGYTVASGDLPVHSPGMDYVMWIGYLIGAGRAVTAATISFRMKKNGASVATSSSAIAANTYYTRHCFFRDVAIGDVLEIALWSNQTDSNYDYKAFQIHPSRVLPHSEAPILTPFNFTSQTAYPTLTLGNPSVNSTAYATIYFDDILSLLMSSLQTFHSFQPWKTYGLYRANYGDVSNANSSLCPTSATYRPSYNKNTIPTAFNFRRLII